MVIASEVVFTSSLVEPLVNTLGLLRKESQGADVAILLCNQVIQTVSFNANKEPVVDTDDAVMLDFLVHVRSVGWYVGDMTALDEGGAGESRTIALCTSHELLEEITADEDEDDMIARQIATAWGRKPARDAAASLPSPAKKAKHARPCV